MKYQIMYFSPTGNTLYLAKKLRDKLNCELINFNGIVDCDHLIIMSSIHAFRIPNFLVSKINNIKKISIICVGCNKSFVNDASGYKLIKYAKKNKIDVGVYKILEMPLTIVKKFDIDYGLKIIDESVKEINVIYQDIINNNDSVINISFKSKIISKVNYIESFFVKLFGLELHANKDCIKCGKCVRDCPKNNIVIKDKVKFKLNCMLCMNCVYKCPVKAIHPRISKFIELKDGYNIENYVNSTNKK